MTQILLQSRSDEWYTPNYLVELARKVLIDIDLDPASCEFANATVRAHRFIDAEEDGLVANWSNVPVNVFLNPPSGRHKGKSLMKQFWERLLLHREAGLLNHCVFVGFSLEQLQVTQNCTVPIANFPICIPKSRVKFVSPSGIFNSPTHGQVIAYVPGLINETATFYKVFSELGACMFPQNPI